MQYKNIQLVEGIKPNQNANSYGRKAVIFLDAYVVIEYTTARI